MKLGKKMTEYVMTRALNLELIELTLLSIFGKRPDVTERVDIIRDFILFIENSGNLKKNHFVKVTTFEITYLKQALKEIKNLNGPDNI